MTIKRDLLQRKQWNIHFLNYKPVSKIIVRVNERVNEQEREDIT